MPPTSLDRRSLCLALAGGAMGLGQGAKARARFDEKSKLFRLDGGAATYAMGIDAQGRLQSLYWGARLADDDVLPPAAPVRALAPLDGPGARSPEEYPGWGGGLFTEPALKLAYVDGVRDLVLRYASHRLDGDVLRIRLKDILRELHVELTYAMDAETGVLARSVVIENGTSQIVRLDQVAAAAFTLPVGDYDLHYLTGRWWAEWQLQTRAVTSGATVL